MRQRLRNYTYVTCATVHAAAAGWAMSNSAVLMAVVLWVSAAGWLCVSADYWLDEGKHS